MNEQIDSLQEVTAVKEQKINELEQNTKTGNGEYDQIVMMYEDEIKRLRNKTEILEGIISTKEEEIDELQQKLHQAGDEYKIWAENEIQRIQEEMSEREKEIIALKENEEYLNQEISRLEGEIQEKQEETEMINEDGK